MICQHLWGAATDDHLKTSYIRSENCFFQRVAVVVAARCSEVDQIVSSTSCLDVHHTDAHHCRTRLSAVGDRAYPVAAARTWNDLPRHVTSASSPPVFSKTSEDAPLPAFFFVTLVQCRRSDSCHCWHDNRLFYLLTYSLLTQRDCNVNSFIRQGSAMELF